MSQTFNNQIKIPLHAYSPKIKYQLTCPELPYGRTKQAFKDECDINTILKRFLRTGVLDFTNKREAQYGDTTGLEFNQAMQTVAQAKSLFADLPAGLRARFKNDPAEFLDFVQDDRNMEEARKLGLLKPAKTDPLASPEPASATPAPALASPPKSP